MSSFVHEHLFQIATVILISAIIVYPELLSLSGIAVVIAWVYGLLLAKVVRICFQYALIHWGINRMGIMLLSLSLMLCGCACMYYAYAHSSYSFLGIGWIAAYVGFDSAMYSYKKQVSSVWYQLVSSLEYLVVALLALALFGGYVANTPLGQLGFEYQGLRGESLLFVAGVMLAAEVVHDLYYMLRRKILKMRKSS